MAQFDPALTRRTLFRVAAAAGVGAALPIAAHTHNAAHADPLPPVKTAPTFYTSAKVTAIRANVTNYDWAQELRDTAIAKAQSFLDGGDAWIWSLVGSQKVPRCWKVTEITPAQPTSRSPVNGPYTGLGDYSWHGDDPYAVPAWKVIDPTAAVGAEDPDYPGNPMPRLYPSNDFDAYYRSGLNNRGEFDSTLADSSLLVNTLYPWRGPTWGVDDGNGWTDPATNVRYAFIAYHHQWYRWLNEVGGKGMIHTGIRALRDAYLYTGSIQYAHAGIILLDRIADIYPSLHLVEFYGKFANSSGGTWQGKSVGSIWEGWLAKDLALAYDVFFQAIASTDQANVLPFLSARVAQYPGLAAKSSVADIRKNIENGILRQIMPSMAAAEIRGNFGMHQSALAAAAVVLDDPTVSPGWIDWIFQYGELKNVSSRVWTLSGGEVDTRLIDKVDHDGCGNEAAPAYNRIWPQQLKDVADVLNAYQTQYPTGNLYTHPKMKMLFECSYPFTMLNRYVPSIGDGGKTGEPWLMVSAREYVQAFERFGKQEYAQMAYLTNGNTTAGLYGDIDSPSVSATQTAIQNIIDTKGPLNLIANNLTGVGFVALRYGTADKLRGAWLNYGRNTGHGHQDTLNLGIHAFDLDLAQDLGYPESVGTNALRMEWNANTVAHNTVVVDSAPQAAQIVGLARGFANTGRIKYVELEAPTVYPQASMYRRATVGVIVDGTNSYFVDFFRVVGGTDHHFSFHGAEGPASLSGATMTVQPTGTYAGANVYPPSPAAAPRPGASGFDWLSNVSRGNPAGTYAVDWDVVDTWNVHDPDKNVHLRLTMLNQVDDVALCDGIPPQNKPGNPEKLRYLIAHRHAAANLASQFVSVIEPYLGSRFVQTMQTATLASNIPIAAHEASAVKVTTTSGRVDYIISSTRPDATLTIDGTYTFTGRLGAVFVTNGIPSYAMCYGGTIGPLPHTLTAGVITGTLQSFTQGLADTSRLTVTLDQPLSQLAGIEGSYVYVTNDDERNAVYRIVNAGIPTSTTLVLEFPNSLIRGHVDPKNPPSGYIYDVAVGAQVRVPLTAEWVAS